MLVFNLLINVICRKSQLWRNKYKSTCKVVKPATACTVRVNVSYTRRTIRLFLVKHLYLLFLEECLEYSCLSNAPLSPYCLQNINVRKQRMYTATFQAHSAHGRMQKCQGFFDWLIGPGAVSTAAASCRLIGRIALMCSLIPTAAFCRLTEKND